MEILLNNLGKKYNREILFTELNYKFCSKIPTAIIGENGSGKSTLIQLIAGNILPSNGSISYNHERKISNEDIFKHISIAAPYVELIEEFTLLEQLQFHFKFKKLRKGESVESIINLAYFEQQKHKQIKNFSSGMKQRLKLLIALYADTEILLLDEPTSNLDEKGKDWYDKELKHPLNDRLVILASNQPSEYINFSNILNLNEFK